MPQIQTTTHSLTNLLTRVKSRDATPSKKNQFAKFISSEGALYVILPYDYPAPPTF